MPAILRRGGRLGPAYIQGSDGCGFHCPLCTHPGFMLAWPRNESGRLPIRAAVSVTCR